MKKRLWGLMFLFTALFSTSVLAQTENFGRKVVEALGWISTLDLTRVGVDLEATFWAKILMFFVVFTIFFFAGSVTLFKDNRKIAGVLAAIIGLFVMFLPNSLFRYLFQTYTAVLLLILFGIPIGALVFVMHALKKWILEDHPKAYHTLAAILSLILMFVLNNLEKGLVELDIEALLSFTNWTAFVYAFLNLYVIYQIIMIFVSGKKSRDVVGNATNKSWEWLTKNAKAFATKEGRLGRNMKKFAKRAKKSIGQVVDELKVVKDGVETARTNPAVVDTVAENVENVRPAVVTGLEDLKEYEKLSEELGEWNKGYIAKLKEEKEELKKEAARVKAEITRDEKRPWGEKKYKAATANQGIDIVHAHEEVIKKIDDLIEDTEAMFVQATTMDEVYVAIDAELREVWADLEKLRTLFSGKTGDFLNQAFIIIEEAIKKAERSESGMAKVMEYITNLRALIGKERIDVRKLVKDIKDARVKARRAAKGK